MAEEQNAVLNELANRQHGTIIRDESTRVKEGAAELVDSQPDVESARLLSTDKADFNQNYKYTPKDNKLPSVRASKSGF